MDFEGNGRTISLSRNPSPITRSDWLITWVSGAKSFPVPVTTPAPQGCVSESTPLATAVQKRGIFSRESFFPHSLRRAKDPTMRTGRLLFLIWSKIFTVALGTFGGKYFLKIDFDSVHRSI